MTQTTTKLEQQPKAKIAQLRIITEVELEQPRTHRTTTRAD